MTSLTITEALAEIQTVGKRLAKKRDFVAEYLARQEGLKDPLVNEGGSVQAIARERQAIRDLEERIVAIRRAIQRANGEHSIAVGGETRSVADWLVWRREIAANQAAFVTQLRQRIQAVRREAQTKGFAVTSAAEARALTDVIINVDEGELAAEAERLETIVGELDGQLSLKNATIVVDVG